jgi:Uma2 family endonuclease
MLEVPPQLVAWRKRTGNDKFDEMWEGVLHMPPAPNLFHQDLEGELEAWLRSFWARPAGNRVFHNVNLASPGGWPDDYRVPDLVLLTPGCFDIMRGVCLEGAPTVVIEIRSPGDETIEKLPFYALLGVPEVWIIEPDARESRLYVLRAGHYEEQPPAADGWLHSAAAGVQLRGEAENRLTVQIAGDEVTRRLLPET